MSVPNPATTEWVPLGNSRALDLRYLGAYVAGSYQDGDVVVDSNGITYMCVRPTTAAPVAWPGQPGSMGTLAGTYAAMPAASSVFASTIYYATDVQASFRSNGTTWTLVSAGTLAGTYAAMPAATAVPSGTQYRATDTMGTFWSDGAVWTLVQQGRPTVTTAQLAAAPFSTPYDGQEVALLVDATNGVEWHFKYRVASASSYKWEFLGGAPARAAVGAQESFTTSGGVYVNVATVGPSFVVPRAGDYYVQFNVSCSDSAAQLYIQAGVGVGDFTSPAIDAPAGIAAANAWAQSTGLGTLPAVAAGAEIRLKYGQASAGTAYVRVRNLAVAPVRIS